MRWISVILCFMAFQTTYAQNANQHSSDSSNSLSVEKICSYYAENTWLPDAYIHNATCACKNLTLNAEGTSIRQVLKQELEGVDQLIKDKLLMAKQDYACGKLTRRKYRLLLKKTLSPLVYQHHKLAFSKVDCKGRIAPYPVWKFITVRKVKSCKTIWFGMRFFASCSGKIGKW